jgi:chromosome segregation ATPase
MDVLRRWFNFVVATKEGKMNDKQEYYFDPTLNMYEVANHYANKCEYLKEQNKTARKRINELTNELDNINAEKEELQDDIDYYDNVIQDLRVRNENYLDEIEKLKERIKNLQNVIERLGGENG